MATTVSASFKLLTLSGAGEIGPGLYIRQTTMEKLVQNSTHVYAWANRRALIAMSWVNGIATSSIAYERICNSFTSFSADRFAVSVEYQKEANCDLLVEIRSTDAATTYHAQAELGTGTYGTLYIDCSSHASFTPGQDVVVYVEIKNSGAGTVKLNAITIREAQLASASLPPVPISATIATGDIADGYNIIMPADGYTVWATAIAATDASAGGTTSASATFSIQLYTSRGASRFGVARGYYRFAGSSFASGITKVESATIKIHCGALDNSPDTDVNKWKLFKHNNISDALDTDDFSNFDASVSGDEVTVTAGGYVSFPVTGALLAYVNCQAKSQANVAFSLRCKLDYEATAPTGLNSVNWHFSEETSDKDPQLEYTYLD